MLDFFSLDICRLHRHSYSFRLFWENMEARKNAEGEGHMLSAAKYMETSFFKLKFRQAKDCSERKKPNQME